jgi:hypothetical protein
VRALLLVVLVCALTACGDERPEARAPDDDLFVLDEAERRAFEKRLAGELAAAPARRDRQLRANRNALDRVPPFPGAVLHAERRQGTDVDEPEGDDELEYAVFVEQEVEPYSRFELVTADRWSTYRHYLLPRGTGTTTVQRHYARALRGWVHRARERGTSAVGGHALYADDYWRNGRCIWVHVGLAESSLPPARTLVVATSAEKRADCL